MFTAVRSLERVQWIPVTGGRQAKKHCRLVGFISDRKSTVHRITALYNRGEQKKASLNRHRVNQEVGLHQEQSIGREQESEVTVGTEDKQLRGKKDHTWPTYIQFSVQRVCLKSCFTKTLTEMSECAVCYTL